MSEHIPVVALPYRDIQQDPALFEVYETELQVAAQARDVVAFGLLTRAYRPILLAQSRRSSGNLRQEAEDFVQSAILKVFDPIMTNPEGERPLPALPYFSRAVGSVIADVRKRKYGFVVFDPLKSGAENPTAMQEAINASFAADNDTTIYNHGERVMENVMAVEALKALKRHLRAEEWLLISLRYIEDCSLEEIAELTGWQYRTVKTKFGRIFERARKLENRGLVERPDSAKG